MKKLGILILVVLFWAEISYSQSKAVEASLEYRQQHEIQILKNYLEFLKIPNMASDLPNIRRNAKYLMSEVWKERCFPR